MKVRYVGQSFYVEGLTDGQIYECLGVEGPFLRVIDDSGEDYLYTAVAPGPLDLREGPGGRWEIVEDDAQGTLRKAIFVEPTPL